MSILRRQGSRDVPLAYIDWPVAPNQCPVLCQSQTSRRETRVTWVEAAENPDASPMTGMDGQGKSRMAPLSTLFDCYGEGRDGTESLSLEAVKPLGWARRSCLGVYLVETLAST